MAKHHNKHMWCHYDYQGGKHVTNKVSTWIVSKQQWHTRKRVTHGSNVNITEANTQCPLAWITKQSLLSFSIRLNFPSVLVFFNSYNASHDNWCTETLLNRVITAQWEGMGDVGSARYESALLPPCPTIRVLCYSNCQRSTHSRQQFKG